MAGGLASSSFSAGAKEVAATVDVYAKTTRDTINSIQDVRKLFDTDLLESFRGGNFAGGLRPIIKGIDSLGLILDKSALVTRLLGSNPRLMAGFKKLTGGIGDAITKMYEAKDGIFATVNGVVQKVSAAAVENVKALGGLIGDVVGDAWDFVVDDKDGLSTFYSGLIKEAQELGIPNSFKEIIATVRDPNLINRITQKVIPGIVGTSDVGGLLAAAVGTSKGVLTALNPQILSDFSRKYMSPLNGTTRDLQRKGNDIFRAFDAVDKGWDKMDRILGDGERDSIFDLSMLQNSSKDAKEAIRSGIAIPAPDLEKKDRDFYTLAETYKPVSVHEEIKKDFPQATSRIDLEKDRYEPGPLLEGYYEVKAKQDAYSTDMNLIDKIKNVYF